MIRYFKSILKSITTKPDPNSLLPKLHHDESRVRQIIHGPKPTVKKHTS